MVDPTQQEIWLWMLDWTGWIFMTSNQRGHDLFLSCRSWSKNPSTFLTPQTIWQDNLSNHRKFGHQLTFVGRDEVYLIYPNFWKRKLQSKLPVSILVLIIGPVLIICGWQLRQQLHVTCVSLTVTGGSPAIMSDMLQPFRRVIISWHMHMLSNYNAIKSPGILI